MQIKSVIIDSIHYINFIIFDISNLFVCFFLLLICPAEIEVRLIHLCVLYSVKYGTWNHITVQTNYYDYIEIITWNHMIISIW